MRKRKCRKWLCYVLAISIGAILAFVLPLWFVAALEAVIILVFALMLLFG